MRELIIKRNKPDKDNIGFTSNGESFITLKFYHWYRHDATLVFDNEIYTIREKGFWATYLVISKSEEAATQYKLKYRFFRPYELDLGECGFFRLHSLGGFIKDEWSILDQAGVEIMRFSFHNWSFRIEGKAILYIHDNYPYLKFILGVTWFAVYNIRKRNNTP